MKTKNQEVNHTNFSRARMENDPVSQIRKRIGYLRQDQKKIPDKTKRFEQEIRADIGNLKKLAARRHGPEASRLSFEADQLSDELRSALKGDQMHDHGSSPDPRAIL
jgi:hypothetical protein